jgi:hypothetical protein
MFSYTSNKSNMNKFLCRKYGQYQGLAFVAMIFYSCSYVCIHNEPGQWEFRNESRFIISVVDFKQQNQNEQVQKSSNIDKSMI